MEETISLKIACKQGSKVENHSYGPRELTSYLTENVTVKFNRPANGTSEETFVCNICKSEFKIKIKSSNYNSRRKLISFGIWLGSLILLIILLASVSNGSDLLAFLVIILGGISFFGFFIMLWFNTNHFARKGLSIEIPSNHRLMHDNVFIAG
jgi:hypothetical protein